MEYDLFFILLLHFSYKHFLSFAFLNAYSWINHIYL